MANPWKNKRGRCNHDKKKHTDHDKTCTHHAKYCTTVSQQHTTAPRTKPRSLGSTHLGTFKRLHSLASKCVLPAAPPASKPRSLESTQFGTFKGPNSQNVYSQLLPPLQSPDRLRARILGLSRAKTPKMCTPSCFPHQSPKCVLSAAPPFKAQIPWEYAF